MKASADLWYVYMVICNDQTIYTGIAKDPQRRLFEHNNGESGAKYTRSRRPVEIVYQEKQPSRSAATKREIQLKKLTRAKKLQLCQKLSSAHTSLE